MKASLDPSFVKVYEKKTEKIKVSNPNVLPIFDTEKGEWRSLNLNNFISIE